MSGGAEAGGPVIVLEFNELTPSFVDGFIAEGRLPNFDRLRARSAVLDTVADAEPPNLEPWIQWVTVHTGVPFATHGVAQLNQGQSLETPRTWDLVSGAGHAVLVGGSMNARRNPELRGVFIPDPWADPTSALPSELAAYTTVVRAYVQEHTNDRVPVGPRDYARFAALMARRGLSPATVKAIVRQLVQEAGGRRRHLDSRWKRVALLDLLQFDLFTWYHRRTAPRLSTFFLNSTAHLQHRYWRYQEPDAFVSRPSAAELASYREAIGFGYEAMDRLVGRFIDTYPGATLVFCTALSQRPATDYRDTGGKITYRPRRFDAVLTAAGVANTRSCSPVMSEEFYASFDSADDAAAALERLRQLRVDGRPAVTVRMQDTELFLGCGVHDELRPDAVLETPTGGRPFFDLFYAMGQRQSGVHDPAGMLWVSGPGIAPGRHDGAVALTRVAPTVLRLCGIEAPSWMDEPLDLVPAWATAPAGRRGDT